MTRQVTVILRPYRPENFNIDWASMDNSKSHSKPGKQQTNAPELPPDAEARVILVRFTCRTEYLDQVVWEMTATFAGSEKRGFLCCAFFWISIRRAPFPSCGITSHDVNFSASSSRPYRSMSTLLDSFIQPLLGHVFLASTEESLCSVALVSTLPTHLTTSPETVSYLSVSGVLAGYFFTKVRVLEFL